jgi:hypothetical protein
MRITDRWNQHPSQGATLVFCFCFAFVFVRIGDYNCHSPPDEHSNYWPMESVFVTGCNIGVLFLFLFLFLCSRELAIITATHHKKTLGSSLMVSMQARIATIPQA